MTDDKLRLYAVRNERGEWLFVDSGHGYTANRFTASTDVKYAKHWPEAEARRLAREHGGTVVTFVPESELAELRAELAQAKAQLTELRLTAHGG